MLFNNILKGRRRVEINVKLEDFLNNPVEILESKLGDALSIHKSNVSEMEIIHNELVGDQNIFNKTRSDYSNINNKEVENHLYPIWRFKTSYIVGRPIQYSNKGGEGNDDMKYFNRYLDDCKKAQNDIKVYGDVYEYGVGYRMLFPKKRIFDDEWESPLNDYYLDPKNVFACYSKDVSNELLFTCVISQEKNNITKRNQNVYTVYFEGKDGHCNVIDFDSKYKEMIGENRNVKEEYKGNPIFEYTENKYRLGIVEIIMGLQNVLNHIDSCQLDDIDQFIQAYLVFMNIDVDLETPEGIKAWKDTLNIFRNTRAMVLSSQNEQMPADFRQIANTLDHNAINSFHSRIKNAMYDIAKAPQSSGSVTSGGDTTGARLLGNGWESALTDAELSTNSLKSSEYEWIKFFIRECRASSNKKIDNIYPSEIEIKYNINMSDNALVKTQAISNLYNSNMPKELILTAVPILSDVYKSAKIWEEYDNLKKEENENASNNKPQVSNEQINDMINKSN